MKYALLIPLVIVVSCSTHKKVSQERRDVAVKSASYPYPSIRANVGDVTTVKRDTIWILDGERWTHSGSPMPMLAKNPKYVEYTNRKDTIVATVTFFAIEGRVY